MKKYTHLELSQQQKAHSRRPKPDDPSRKMAKRDRPLDFLCAHTGILRKGRDDGPKRMVVDAVAVCRSSRHRLTGLHWPPLLHIGTQNTAALSQKSTQPNWIYPCAMHGSGGASSPERRKRREGRALLNFRIYTDVSETLLTKLLCALPKFFRILRILQKYILGRCKTLTQFN